jgi:hypothetical protein
MCNYYSGHIVTEKGKDWGKVLMITGVHHEKDREDSKVSKYGENLLAWETVKEFTFSEGIKFTHACGQKISAEEKQALKEIVEDWAKEKGGEYFLRFIQDDDGRYRYCVDVEDLESLYSKIEDDYYRYFYCMDVEDRESVYSKIESDEYRYRYCKDVEDRESVYSKIESDKYRYLYCMDVEDRESLYSKIESDEYRYRYCRDIKDRESLYSKIEDDYYRYRYCRDIKNRKELH